MVRKGRTRFSKAELERYTRHLVMPEVGLRGQKRLKESSVLIVGAGGLGTPAAIYLAAAGVGRIGIVDFDRIERSNLHRQILYSESDVGKRKVQVAKARLRDINPNVEVETYSEELDSSNAMRILKGYDVVVDGSDNFPTRYLVNDACVFLGKPDVYASVFRFDGQASVFFSEEGPCYRCLYPEPPPAEEVQSCNEAGVFGVLPGIMGGMQAAETINLLLGSGSTLVGRLVVFDAKKMQFSSFKLKKNPQCILCGPNPSVTKLIDYDAFCGIGKPAASIPETTPLLLKRSIDNGPRPQLLDVREPFEYQLCHITGSKLIPLGQLPQRANELDRKKPIVAYCHTGRRSARAVEMLSSMGFRDVRNLKGGIAAWADQVDRSMTRY